MKHLEITDNDYGTVDFYSKPSWHCVITDNDGNEREVALGFIVETMDMLEVCGECSNESYPVNLEISIMVSNPDRYFVDDDMDGEKLENIPQAQLIEACVGYMGAIPVTHKLLASDSINKKLLDKLSLKDACLETVNRTNGTVAAQCGAGNFTFPSFKTADGAADFGKALVDAYGDTMMSLIGFTLDQPVNMIGDTGWSVIEKMVEYKR